MTARALTALLGGYAAAAALATLFVRIAPIARVEATVWAMTGFFALYVAIGLWCFREPRLGRAAALVWGAAVLSAGLLWLLGTRP